MAKTIEEINEKIRQGKAVVVTAEEMIGIVKEKGVEKAAKEVDVVTTGTFGVMCSSGIYFNIGHTKPRIKLGGGKVYLNGVPAYAAYSAADLFLGATALPDDDPRNKYYPGEFPYGGGHVIEELIAGKDIRITAQAYGTDCYPKKSLDAYINIHNLNEAMLFNVRNAYQNYNVAVNSSDKAIYTYLGMLKPRFGNANYSSAGQLSPLLNDPYYKTIGIGTRIFLGGGMGYVIWHGTQHDPGAERTERGIPKVGAGTLAVIGDLKQMNPEWIRGVSVKGYGASLAVGIGIPIPILNEEMAFYTSVSDEEIYAPIVDYATAYPNREPDIITYVTYKELRSGEIEVLGKKIPTNSLSSYPKAKKIAETLKSWIQEGSFLMTSPSVPLPGPESGIKFKPFSGREILEEVEKK
ncbi:MAG TPA: homocysteine biosynthesis protein [Dictyoglomaceae bacterium]|nr:homocysteine biosynthesis protein [Dictyoglomaceae bacterium]HOL39025.1 homocysteine biosynthesis protein [Dictyoglomaceae bacterium]HOP94364.1 homocysteine biosynthesis protein [Dictyoglomaceae bacterium]HPP15799.1 homocysteine biosynthesis protein [Dictyoglomaceae bacterium]HPU42788.1 homocysteine biosynthesis protein [Dictyoglomaceae bacterium]